MKKAINLKSRFQLNNEKPGKRFFLDLWKYFRVFENLSLRKNGMHLRLHKTVKKDCQMNFKNNSTVDFDKVKT